MEDEFVGKVIWVLKMFFFVLNIMSFVEYGVYVFFFVGWNLYVMI